MASRSDISYRPWSPRTLVEFYGCERAFGVQVTKQRLLKSFCRKEMRPTTNNRGKSARGVWRGRPFSRSRQSISVGNVLITFNTSCLNSKCVSELLCVMPFHLQGFRSRLCQSSIWTCTALISGVRVSPKNLIRLPIDLTWSKERFKGKFDRWVYRFRRWARRRCAAAVCWECSKSFRMVREWHQGSWLRFKYRLPI